MSLAKHGEYLQAPSPTLASHHTVGPMAAAGVVHATGVAGVWVHLLEARDYAKRLALQDTNLLTNLLREDLFQLVSRSSSVWMPRRR